MGGLIHWKLHDRRRMSGHSSIVIPPKTSASLPLERPVGGEVQCLEKDWGCGTPVRTVPPFPNL